MRVLLDECLPRRLKNEIVGHDVATVPEMGWAGVKNGELLRRAAAERFDAFVTVDQGVAFQQNLASPARHLAVLVLSAPSNRIEALRPLIPSLLRALDRPRFGEVLRVD